MENGRCRQHGGATPKGIDHPRHKDHLRGQLPARLHERYLQAERDPDLLSLNHEIRLTDVFLHAALEDLSDSPPAQLWNDLGKQWAALLKANADRDSAASTIARDAISALIAAGIKDSDARAEALDIMDKRRKLVESEGKRQIALQQTITVESAMLLMAAIEQIVLRYVDNAAQRAAISVEFAQLASQSS